MLILNNLTTKPENNQPKIVKKVSFLNRYENYANNKLLNYYIANKIFSNLEIKFTKLQTITQIQKQEILDKIIKSLLNNKNFNNIIENKPNSKYLVDQVINRIFTNSKITNFEQNFNIFYNDDFASQSNYQSIQFFSNLLYGTGITAGIVSGVASAAAAGYYAAAWFFGITLPEAIDCTALAASSIALSKDISNQNYFGIELTIGEFIIENNLSDLVNSMYAELIVYQSAIFASEVFDPAAIIGLAGIATTITFMTANSLI